MMKTIFLSLIFTTISSLGTSLSNAQTVAAPLTATQEATQKGQENFSIGKNTFLLNGKPIVIKAAEIHYPRIPEPYWEQRIEMCKALGMNTICIYIFWNLHEQQPGEFDFTGNKDIAKFCRLAQKHGMYVIVRPGPYVCAEWEMGGLPWWLLKKKDIALRTLDPYYMKRVKIFMNKVGEQLAGLQITRGGNIIMVQVENEYGSYGTDKPYVSAIRDIVKGAGFTDVPLFQCDWSSNFLNNALPDLLWTVNFGTGANIDNQFKKLKEVRPDSPLMCSEFWSGWFDHWGRKHETRDATAMVNGIRDMLDRNISFSLYMTHGGTTFGHWGGANNPAYSCMCSSYDYDAPISEAGWTTDKYWKLRNLLASYLPKGEKLPDVPAQYPVIEIPTIHFNQVAPLFNNLPEKKSSQDIQPMEQFNQGWGSILYRTKLPETIQKGTLKITEVHDWAQVYANGKLLGRLDRRHGEYTLPLSGLKAGTQLDLLIEAMGRVNFDKSIHDCKGITEKVEIIQENKTLNLKNWEVYNFPTDYSFTENKHYIDTRKAENHKIIGGKTEQTQPAYYRATFTLAKVGDTFLDMRTWGKGMVWVNGHAMGRFWEIGPQQTLYMPGCWLKKGKNEIIVLDLLGPQKAEITGLKKPILDMLREKAPETHRKEGQILKLNNEQPVWTGTFTKGNGWQDIKFNTAVKGRFFCLEANSPFDETNIAAIAEIDVLGIDGNPVSREKWSIRYADSEETRSGNHTADKIYDRQESTYWQTVDNTAYPHQLVIDLGKEYTLTGFRILPRMEKEVPGQIKESKIYVKSQDFIY
ncbi:MAG: beta-galactosidase [Bacteroides sp.]|jgi:beta-galactosidase|nr:beta-galactosidase [Bacteroides sp.]